MAVTDEANRLLEQEENVLKEVVCSLQSQLTIGGRRLRAEEERAQGLTARLVAARRDVEKQLLASDEAVSHKLRDLKKDEIETIEKLVEKPYFARIVLEEEDPHGGTKSIEFRLGVAANSECRIIDWRRAPISKLYYEYNEGEEYSEEIQGRERNGRVVLRHKVDIERSELKKVTCRLGSFEKRDGVWEAAGGRSRARSAQSYGTLPDVLSLITPEQFRAITQDAETAILIQGVAGSGKTTVALHRLAWLLFGDNSDLKPGEAVILVRSRALKEYIANALPALGIEKVHVLGFHEWAARCLAWLLASERGTRETIRRPQGRTPPGIERVIGSMAMLTALERYVVEQKRRLVRWLREIVPADRLTREAEQSLRLLEESKLAPVPFFERFLTALFPGGASRPVEQPAPAGSQRDLETELRTASRRMQLYQKDVVAILAHPRWILEHDETSLLDEDLIHAAHEQIRAELERNEVAPSLDALLLRLGQLKSGAMLLPDGREGRYRHILVDEVQDFSSPELAVLVGSVEQLSQLTLVGDTGQAIGEGHTFPGWEKLREHWALGSSLSQFISLSVSHRSTLQIMRLGDHILGERRTTEGRPGKPPLWYHCRHENQGIAEVIGWLSRVMDRYPDSIVAVLCRAPSEARYAVSLLQPTFGSAVRLGDDSSFGFQEGIVVTDIAQVKGLEFAHVLIWNPSAATYRNDRQSRNLLYVAVSRAEENLCLVTWDRPSPLLPPLASNLVRGIDRAEELAEEERNAAEEPVESPWTGGGYED